MKISVCMATYNGAKYISVQLKSILDQIGPDDELVIVDDASVDTTVEIIKAFNDARIRLYLNTLNTGAVQAFDQALHLARGDLVFLSDQDDRWYDTKVAVIKALFAEGDLDLVVHDARVVSGEKVVAESLFRLCKSSPSLLRNIVTSTHTGCCMVLRKDLLQRLLPIPKVKGIYHDSWIGIMSGLLGSKKIFLPVPLIDYNRHDANVSTMKRRSMRQVLPDRIRLILALAGRLLQKR